MQKMAVGQMVFLCAARLEAIWHAVIFYKIHCKTVLTIESAML